MAHRVTRSAEDQIDRIILESANRFGIEAAARYNRLLQAVMFVVGAEPRVVGSSAVPRHPGVRSYPLRAGRSLVGTEHRVRSPRHLVIYQVAPDGVVEILGLVHDRQALPRAVGHVVRNAQNG